MWDVRFGIAECGMWIADLKKQRAEGLEHRVKKAYSFFLFIFIF
jgi:hypothetical protein